MTMVVEDKNYVELAKKFIDEHNNNNNWSPFDRIETMAIIMYAKWLESNSLSLEKDKSNKEKTKLVTRSGYENKEGCLNENILL